MADQIKELLKPLNEKLKALPTDKELRGRYGLVRTMKVKRNLRIRHLRRNGITASAILKSPLGEGMADEDNIYRIEKSSKLKYVEKDYDLV